MPTTLSAAVETPRPDIRDRLDKFDLEADQAGFVGLKIAPALEVSEAFGQFPTQELKDRLKSHNTERNFDGSYPSTEHKTGKGSYATEEHGIEERVDDRYAKMYGNWVDAEELAAQGTRDAVLRNHNARVIAAALSISTTNAAGTAWSTTATSDPIANLRAARLAMRARGVQPGNCLVIDWEAYEYLLDNDKILERVKYSGHYDPRRGNITVAAVAQALDVEELIISGSIKNTANEAQAASIASMWDKTKALLFRRVTGKNTKLTQFMRTFHWGADGSQIGGTFESYYSPERRGEVIRNRMDTDEKLLYEEAGQIITGVL